MKKLSKDQLQELFDFTKSHRVRYYDLQSELVDHLASAIESKWMEDPVLSFQTALNQVYADFGIYGFGKLEQEKREAIQSKIVKKVLAFIKSYFTIPKVGLTLLVIVLTHFGLSLFANPVDISIGLIYFFMAGLSIAMYFQQHKNKGLKDKFLEVHAVCIGGYSFLFLFVLPVELFIFSDQSGFSIWFLASWLVVSGLAFVGTYQYLKETIEEVKLRYG